MPNLPADAVPVGRLPGLPPDAIPVGPSAPAAPTGDPAGSSVEAFAKGLGGGFGKTVLGAQELLGKGFEALDIPGGHWLVEDAEKGAERLTSEMAGDRSVLGGNHPHASAIGEFAGGLTVPGGVASRVTSAPLRATLGGALGGMLQPETPDVHDFWKHKAEEAALGGAAGVATERLMTGTARVIASQLRPEARALIDEGVVLTPGQAGGGRWRRSEDAVASVPVAGYTIRNAQRMSVETFNRAAINRALDDIGVKLPPGLNSGNNAIDFAEQQFHDAYNNVIPKMTGTIDQQFQGQLVGILQKAQQENLPPALRDQLRHIIGAEVVSRFNTGSGTISGLDAQKVGTQLDVLMSAMRRSPDPYVQHLGRLVKDLDGSFDDMMARNNPQLQAAKDKIDLGYSKFKIVQEATSRATGMRESPEGTFTPTQLRAAVRSRDKSKDKAAFARGDAQMQDLASAAMNVLPQTVPDSGTSERRAMMAILGGIGAVDPRGLVVVGLPYTAYTEPGMRVFNKLLQRPGLVRQAVSDTVKAAGPVLAPGMGAEAAEQFLGTQQKQ